MEGFQARMPTPYTRRRRGLYLSMGYRERERERRDLIRCRLSGGRFDCGFVSGSREELLSRRTNQATAKEKLTT